MAGFLKKIFSFGKKEVVDQPVEDEPLAPINWSALKDLTKTIEHLKAKIRARVEHPFHILKNLFGYCKVRYQGLKKNAAQFEVLFALVNLVIAKKALLA